MIIQGPIWRQLDAVVHVLREWAPTNQNVVEGDWAAAINDLRTAELAQRQAGEALAVQLAAAEAEVARLRGVVEDAHAIGRPAARPIDGPLARRVVRTGVTRRAYATAADPVVAWAELSCGHTVYRGTRPVVGGAAVCDTCAKAARA